MKRLKKQAPRLTAIIGLGLILYALHAWVRGAEPNCPGASGDFSLAAIGHLTVK
jgi:hypothetical protein